MRFGHRHVLCRVAQVKVTGEEFKRLPIGQREADVRVTGAHFDHVPAQTQVSTVRVDVRGRDAEGGGIHSQPRIRFDHAASCCARWAVRAAINRCRSRLEMVCNHARTAGGSK